MRKAAIVLAAALLTGRVFAADSPKDTKPGKRITAVGVLTDNKADVTMIWVDGEDAPTKFALAEGFDKNTFGFPPKGNGVFVPDRVQFTYIKGDDGNKVLTMRRAKTPLKGTVTGEVQFSNDFWVAVKPQRGPLDGYAITWPPGSMVARLKALKKGDKVTIGFHTDVERHRIDTLQVFPASEDTRTWTAANGKYTVKGTFVSSDTTKVKLKKEDGTVITVALDRLIEEDQAWVQKRLKQ